MSEELLKNIFAAQVLILANQLKAEKAAKGTFSTSDYTQEAINLIQNKKHQILAQAI